MSNGFLNLLVDQATHWGADIRLVELVCSEEEIEQRLERKSRKQFGKLSSLEEYRKLREAGVFAVPTTLKHDLQIDTAAMTPMASVARIAAMLKQPRDQPQT